MGQATNIDRIDNAVDPAAPKRFYEDCSCKFSREGLFYLTGTWLRHESLVHHPWHLDYPNPDRWLHRGGGTQRPAPLVPCLAKPRRMEPKLEILTNKQFTR